MRKRLYVFTVLVLIISFMMGACNKPESIICGNCSSVNSKDNQFCSNCGTAFFQDDTQKPSDGTQPTTPSENTEPSAEGTPQDTEPAPTQPAPTQPAPTQPAHTHSYSAATCTSPKSCSCGATTGSALGHSWSNATCTSPKTCSRCGTTSGKASAHNYTTKVTVPTCTEKGYTTYTCSACGDSYKDNYTNSSHNYEKYKCTTCGIVDKSHAYEYLIEWVKTNGVTDEDGVAIIEYADQYRHTITYDSSEKYLFVSTYNTIDGSYAYIDLSSKSQNYSYFFGYAYGQSDESTISGKIEASSYTANAPLSYEIYHGPSNYQWKTWFLEYTQAYLSLNVAFLSGFITQCIPGITIADLGFTSY